MAKHFKLGLATSRTQALRISAITVLIFVWVLRWQWSSLTADLSWANSKESTSNGNRPLTGGVSVATKPSPAKPHVQGLGQPLANDIDLSDPDAPFIGWPLKRACDEVEEWLDGVVFMCDNNFGGVGNVRNFILTCIRYAIDAGATGILMPAIRKRKDDNIKIIFDSSDFRPFNYLFDEQNFREAMAENCPQMTVFDTLSDVPNVRYLDNKKTQPDIQKIDPRGLDRPDTDRCDFAELDHQTDRFQVRFKEYLQNPQNGRPPSVNNTRLFRGNDWPGVLWEWPVMRDGPELANTFGGLCKFNRTMMKLGKKALAQMQAFARQHAVDSGAKPQDASNFLGVHLRTEADAETFWPTYEEQEEAYLRKADEIGLAVGYVASGNLTEVHKFATAAKEQVGMTIVSKDDLLDSDDLDELHSLSWDQQGLVDYIVLTGAEYFTGNSRSSFSISVTKKRHLKLEGLYSRPYKLRPNGHGRSFITGPMKEYYEHWLFIWDAMWP